MSNCRKCDSHRVVPVKHPALPRPYSECKACGYTWYTIIVPANKTAQSEGGSHD